MAENSGQVEALVREIDKIKEAAILYGVNDEVAAAIAHADLMVRRITGRKYGAI